MSEIINVACCVFPDGTVFWSDDLNLVPRIVELWRESAWGQSVPEGCMGGVVYVRMPRSAYQSITTVFPNPISEGLFHDGAPGVPGKQQ